MTKKLVVNGDDFGRTESLCYGVIEAYKRGILTSTTIVANSLHFDLAISLAKEYPNLGVGVHLTINEYEPILPPGLIPSLIDLNGHFHNRGKALIKILLLQINPQELANEWEAQIQKVVDAGIRPTHLDGHGHCHASPTIAGMVRNLAEKFDIKNVRMPSESLGYLGTGNFCIGRYIKKTILWLACLPTCVHWKNRLHYPDSFFGFMEGGRLDIAALDKIVTTLGNGVSELMTHPALDNKDQPYCIDYDWERDFNTLTAYSKNEFESLFGVELVSFRNAFGGDSY